MTRQPHFADIYAGKTLDYYRNARGMTQDELAHEIGVTFQQIQKYEKGHNRMAVSTLHKICQALAVAPETFFPSDDVEPKPLPNGIQQEELSRLIRSYCKITDAQERQRAISIVRVYSHNGVIENTLKRTM